MRCRGQLWTKWSWESLQWQSEGNQRVYGQVILTLCKQVIHKFDSKIPWEINRNKCCSVQIVCKPTFRRNFVLHSIYTAQHPKDGFFIVTAVKTSNLTSHVTVPFAYKYPRPRTPPFVTWLITYALPCDICFGSFKITKSYINSYKRSNFCAMPAFPTLFTVEVEPDQYCLYLTHNQEFGWVSTHVFFAQVRSLCPRSRMRQCLPYSYRSSAEIRFYYRFKEGLNLL
jgi:hypothetical protein